MNPNLCRIALRPRDPAEVFDLVFRLVCERWRPMGILLLVTTLPWLVVATVGCVLTHGHWGLLALPIGAAPLIQAPFTMLTGRALFDDHVRVRDVLRETFGVLPGLLAAWFVWAVGVGLDVLTCGLALPLVEPGLAYMSETALLERVGMGRGLRRSVLLSTSQPGTAIVVALSWWLLSLWCAVVGESAGQAIVGAVLQLGQPFGSALDQQVTPYLIAGLLVAQPLHAIYRLLLYVDVRTRLEGWDLQVALRAAGLPR